MIELKHVLKWTVPVDDLDHPIGGGPVVLVACQDDHRSVQVWTEEWLGVRPLSRLARVYGTGQEIPIGDEHVGSTMAKGGRLVWHVYGSPRPAPR